MPFWLFGSGCCLTLEFLRVASDFQGFSSRDLTKCWFNVQTRPDVKARSSSGAATSFKKRTIFKLSSRERERERERGGPFLDGLTSGRPPQRSSNEMVPGGGAPPTWINLPCVNLSA